MNKASGGDGIPAELFQILKEINPKYSLEVLQERGPLPGPKTGLLPNTWK